MASKYIIEWQFSPKHKHYWQDFASGYGTNKNTAKRFATLKQAEMEAHAIMDSRKIGASPRYDH